MDWPGFEEAASCISTSSTSEDGMLRGDDIAAAKNDAPHLKCDALDHVTLRDVSRLVTHKI
jgi:hypothetical protein